MQTNFEFKIFCNLMGSRVYCDLSETLPAKGDSSVLHCIVNVCKTCACLLHYIWTSSSKLRRSSTLRLLLKRWWHYNQVWLSVGQPKGANNRGSAYGLHQGESQQSPPRKIINTRRSAALPPLKLNFPKENPSSLIFCHAVFSFCL